MELISYAEDFVSFLIQNLKETEKIKSIILFGSAARGEATKQSDIDVFLDVSSDKEILQKEIDEIKDLFFESVKFKRYWKLLTIENEINIIAGHLEKWKLKDTMLGNAIILYEKYTPRLEKGKNKIIFNWKNIKPDSKRVMLNKKLFGYHHYQHYYEGILKNYNGKKLGSNVILIDIEGLNEVLKIFRHFGVSVSILRVFEYPT